MPLSALKSRHLVSRLVVVAAVALLFGEAYTHFQPSRWLRSRTARDTENVVARVANQPVTRSQLERATSHRLWLDGKSTESASPDERKSARAAALNDLIVRELLRQQADIFEPQLPVTPAEIDARLALQEMRFKDRSDFASAMKSQRISGIPEMRDRLAARIRREKFVEMRIAPAIRVSDDEAREWFEKHAKSLGQPERVNARHIFIPTLDHPPEEAKAKLDAALARLTAKQKDFATLAREISEDPATKDAGGELGWLVRDRLPADFAAPVFSMEIGKPALVRSRLGWHLVEVTARKPAEPRTYEAAKPEILAVLEATKRRAATAALRQSLRKTAAKEIQISPAATQP